MFTKVAGRMRLQRRRTGAGLIIVTLVAAVAGAAMSPAAVTAPTENEVVRDDVMAIKESVGGRFLPNGLISESTAATLCGNPAGTAFGRVTLKRQRDNAVVFTAESKPGQNNRAGAWETVWATTGAEPGSYTLTSEGVDSKPTVTKLFPFTVRCDRQAPKPLGTVNFVFRPWQHSFKDVFGGGTIGMNTVPAELRFNIGPARSAIVAGTSQTMQFFRLGASAKVVMPTDPASCAGNPGGCVPVDALSCNPAAGCTPRLAFVNHQQGGDQLTGLFDFQSKAFAAFAKTGGRTRVMLSAGTALDGFLGEVKGQLNEMAAKMGVDLPALLGTTVKLTSTDESGESDTTFVSLQNGLEMVHAVSGGGPSGLSVLAPFSLGAGLIVHTGNWSAGYPDLGGGKGSGYGYTVKEAESLPRFPGPLPAPLNILTPNSKLKNIVGKVPAGKGTHVTALAVTTDPGEPNGLPVWLPLLSGGGAIADNGVDFLGFADDTLDAISLELCLAGTCFGGGAMVGTGLAMFGDNPLPLGLGDVPLLFDDNEALAGLMAQIDDVVSSALGSPAILDAVEQVTSLLEPITGPLLEGLALPLPGA